MSHPFQGGVGGDVMSHSVHRGRVPREEGSTNHSQGEGLGEDVLLQNTVSPRTVWI